MGNIVLLDDLTINQIAAGEVIERPASVIKEMVENSIDAGATSVTIEIKNGGISYIRIQDNGKGITRDDVELAFERHATSKIRSSQDLENVQSMGFRGEALASIAAISDIELITKTENEEIGTKVNVKGGDILGIEECGAAKGTAITVRNLFYNTPVRYKFLKKDFTETGYIEDVVTRIALVHPEIEIKLINTGKTVIQTNGSGDLKNVIYSIYGKEIAQEILYVDYEYEYIKVKGVIGKPQIARSNRSNQIFFVNKRYVKDKTLTSAAEQAFKGMLPIGKFAFLVLDVEMPPKKVDVNVHPAKLEVRFEDENTVFKSVYHSIKDTLLKQDLIPEREKNKEIKEATKDAFKITNMTVANVIKENSNIEPIKNEVKEKNEETIKDSIISSSMDAIEKLKEFQNQMKREIEEKKYNNEINRTQENVTVQEKEESEKNISEESINIVTEPDESNSTNLEESKKEEIKTEVIEENKQNGEISVEKKDGNTTFEEMYKQLFGKEPYGGRKQEEKKEEYEVFDEIEDNNLSVFEETEDYKVSQYKFIGIVFNTYIILEIGKEMYIMDQHAAHERIMYEKVKENFYSETEKNSQMLLLPDIITLTHKEMNIAKDNIYLFEKAGFVLEEFGDNTIKLSGVPDICIDLDTKELFMETLDEINTVARTAKQEKEEKFIATIACKSAVKANMVLTKEEVDSLMQELLKLPNPFTCPHGRPTVIKMSKYEIERKFARK